MSAHVLSASATMRATPATSGFVTRTIIRAVAAFVAWRAGAREQRRMAECARLLGHRLGSDTLLSPDR